MKRLICILYILACFILSYAQNEKQELNKSQLVGTSWIQEDGEYVWKISFLMVIIRQSMEKKEGPCQNIDLYII